MLGLFVINATLLASKKANDTSSTSHWYSSVGTSTFIMTTPWGDKELEYIPLAIKIVLASDCLSTA